MLEAQAEAVAVGMVAARPLAVVYQVLVGQVVGPYAALRNHVVAGIPEIVAADFHLVVEKVACGIDSGHVGGRDSAATAHAAAHSAHHVTGEVGAALVVHVVAVEDHAYLRLVGEAAHEGAALVPEFAFSARAGRYVGSSSR